VADLVVDEGLEALVERSQVLARGELAVLVDGLVAGGAVVTRLLPAELPDDPVRTLHPTVSGAIGLLVLLEQLEALGEFPFGGDPPSVAAQPGLAALLGERVDAIGLPLCGVVLPELHVRVRASVEPRHLA
jgi:hypothetical protein